MMRTALFSITATESARWFDPFCRKRNTPEAPAKPRDWVKAFGVSGWPDLASAPIAAIPS